jgi:acyl carrier protein
MTDQRTSVRSTVVEAFRDVLGDDETVEVDSDFFELGGNSILAAQLVARLRRELGVKLNVRDLFRARTAGGLAEVLEQRTAAHPGRYPD